MSSDVARDLEDDVTWPAKSNKASDCAECQAHAQTESGPMMEKRASLAFHDTTHVTLSLPMLCAQAHISFLSCSTEKPSRNR